jgi:cation diffusion facilitator CzcD-associated flavoprotein CzcO
MATCENIIIGAGPYGLSVAAHFRAANIPFEIVGKPMASWRPPHAAGHVPEVGSIRVQSF